MQQQNGTPLPDDVARPNTRPSLWRLVLGMTVSPGATLAGTLGPASPGKGLAVAAAAYASFFGLSGLESGGPGAALGFGLLGAVLGMLGVLAAAVPTSLLSRLLGSPRKLGWTTAAFGSAYSPMLINAAVGLLFHLVLDWNTAVAFGASGLLWSIRPLFAVSASALGDRPWTGLALATVCGGANLLLWAACFGGFG